MPRGDRVIVVVGAGPAGLAAASVLAGAGHEVVVLEAGDVPGGRTRTLEPVPGHRFATCASWIPTFYERTRDYLDGLELVERFERTQPELVVDGRRVRAPFHPIEAARSPLLPWRERTRLALWLARLATSRPPRPGREPSAAFDDVDALTHLRERIGPAVAEHVFRPAFEPRSAIELADTSASLLRSWVNAAKLARFHTPELGMDAPWKRVAEGLDVRYGIEVTEVRPGWIEPFGPADGVVVAVPAPRAAAIVASDVPGRPEWLGDVRYSVHVAGVADRRTDRRLTAQVHPAGAGPHRLGSVAIAQGGPRRWLPEGWERGAVSASGRWSAELLDEHPHDDGALMAVMWDEARRLEPRLFPLEDAEVTVVKRQPFALPVFGPGHATRLGRWRPTAPIALAGDWSCDPSVEGAVRSGERAAHALLAAPASPRP